MEKRVEESGCFWISLNDKGMEFKRENVKAMEYHPKLWWSIDGGTRSPLLSSVEAAVFLLFAHSARNKRGFKVSSQFHNKDRNRMGNEQSDKQSFVVFNWAQLSRVNTALSVSHKTLTDSYLSQDMGISQGIPLLQQAKVNFDHPLVNLRVIDN